jgi:hypothetical protein
VQETLVVKLRGIVKGVTGSTAQLTVVVFKALFLQRMLGSAISTKGTVFLSDQTFTTAIQ